RGDLSTAAKHADQNRWRRQVTIPDVVPHELEMPYALPRLGFEGDERIAVQVVPDSVGAVVVVGRGARGHEDEAALYVERHPRPVVRRAGIRPRVLRPGFIPELAGSRHRVEGPA